jgi:PadR family transcriptional regulator PadR
MYTVLTTNEQLVMLAISRCGRQAYALSIQEEIKTHGHTFTLGVLYTVLARLERRQLIRHRDADPTPERGDRPKRFYALSGTGARALQGCLRIIDSLRAGAYSPQGA